MKTPIADSVDQTKTIDCLSLKRQHEEIKEEVFKAFEEVYNDTAFSGGRFVDQFEKNFASFCNTEYAVACNNGTNALHLALLALEIQEGDEVILPANTFIATAFAVTYVGAVPVFVDCDPDTWQISAADVKNKITQKTKLIIGVHLYGMPFDIEGIKSISKEFNIPFIEDAAQAQGAKYKGESVGQFGEMACFSFYPGKNLGACGEAGGVTTNNKEYVDLMSKLRNQGSSRKYHHDRVGYNMRMGGLEAASLGIKLNYLNGWNKRRQLIAQRYQSEISNTQVTMQYVPEYVNSVYHVFVVTIEERDAFVAHLKQKNIQAAFHYPVPCHLQKAYESLGYKRGDLPNAEYLADHCVSLPMYPELTDEEVSAAIEAVNSF